MKTAIGPYELVRLIDSGGQGKVYLGYDTRLYRQVAIKIHRLPDGRIPRRTAMREARLVAGLCDARVVKIYDVLEFPEYLALVMEYVPGTDLEQVLAATPLRVGSVLRVAGDVAAALAAAQQADIVHGDLKASNVLITAEGRASLADFGIASTPVVGHAGATGGSLEALAPEQLAGGSVDVRTDLFALGRLMYRALTGNHAFPTSVQGARVALLADNYSLPGLAALEAAPDFPVALTDLVRQLLQRKPDKRIQHPHQVRRILRGIRLEQASAAPGELLTQARPHFRPESPSDLPLDIPGQLRGSDLSRRRAFQLEALGRDLLPQTGVARLVAVAMALLGCAGFAWWLQPVPRAMEMEFGDVSVSPEALAVMQVDSGEIARLVSRAIEIRLPHARLTGAARPSVVYAHTGEIGPAPEVLDVRLRCAEVFCLLELQRQGEAGDKAQRLLFADATADQWASEVGQLVAEAYPGE